MQTSNVPPWEAVGDGDGKLPQGRLVVVPEAWLSAGERTELAQLLPHGWREAYPGAMDRAWTRREPAWRLIATVGGYLVAQAGLVVLTPELLGLSDLVVAEPWRGHGFAAALVDVAVWFGDHHGCALAAGSTAPTVRAALEAHGARPPVASRMRLADGTVPDSWLLRGEPSRPVVLPTRF